MNSITISLPTDYTLAQAFEDAALASGWTAQIEHVELVQDAPDTQPVRTTTMVDNPITAHDYGRAVWESVINERINTTRVKALSIRLESGAGATLQDSV